MDTWVMETMYETPGLAIVVSTAVGSTKVTVATVVSPFSTNVDAEVCVTKTMTVAGSVVGAAKADENA